MKTTSFEAQNELKQQTLGNKPKEYPCKIFTKHMFKLRLHLIVLDCGSVAPFLKRPYLYQNMCFDNFFS